MADKVLELIDRAYQENWTELDLSWRGLTKLPSEIGRLKNLEKLVLWGNQLTTLPPEIGNLRNLQELNLNKNQIGKLPREIVNIQNLKKLKLQWNKMTTLPSEILELKGIELLDISHSEFGDIPLELFEKSNLICLRIAGMRLTSLAPAICKLQNLQELDISDNLLSVFPKEILELKSITTLNISNNKFSELHKELWDNLNLTSLNLARLKLSGLPTDIGKLQNLQDLDLHDNRLEVLPSEIGRLQNLLFLNFSGNFLKKIPEDLAMLKHLQGLAVGGNKFTEFPEVILEAIQLKNLSMGGIILNGRLDSFDNLSVQYSNANISEISSLPKDIGNLNNLEQLFIGNSEIAVLPNEIGNLCQLKRLYLNSNKLTALPSTIGNLQNLRDLLFSDNMISYIPDEIGLLQNLEHLSASNNKLSVFPAAITKLTKIQILSFYENKLSELPSGIGNLVNLKYLAFEKNLLTILPPEIGNLKKLYRLNLNRNRLSAIPLEIGNLQDLNTLDLNYNRISNLPPEIGKLNDLQRLHLINNQLVALPSELRNLQKLSSLAIGGNPLDVYIPPEIISRTDSPQTIINYYLEHKKGKEEGKTRPLNEVKLILVGQGGVGKTSLVNRLLFDKFNPDETKTPGIAINKWKVDVKGDKIQLNIWDFGGQEIMHATHQLFMTKRSIYILVLDARQGENEGRLEYWLKMIESFGADSPIIVACNKSEEHKIDLNWTGLQNKYPNIKGFVKEMSCKTGVGIDEAKELIKKATGELEHIRTPLLETWFEVKENLENMREKFNADFIPSSDYHNLCEDRQIDSEISQKTLLGFLHDLGIVLCYQDDPRLEFTYVLNPHWVTEGVYEIMNSCELFHTKGVLEIDTLHKILNRLNKPGEERYPRDRHLFIIDMMRKFELCFDFVETRDTKFLIPDLLSRDEPFTGEWNDSLAFQYHYDVLPPSVISRFIVRMHKSILKNTYWRTGVVLTDGGNRALVKADIIDKKIFIYVDGNEYTRRDFLSKIRGQFNSIHATITGIKAEEKVPIPGHPKAPPTDYENLLDMKNAGIIEYLPLGMKETVSVAELLEGIERKPNETDREEERGRDVYPFTIEGGKRNIGGRGAYRDINMENNTDQINLGEDSEKGFLEIVQGFLKKIPGLGRFFPGE